MLHCASQRSVVGLRPPAGFSGSSFMNSPPTSIHQTLGEGGMFIQFQHSLLDRKKIRTRFPNLRTVPVLLNFPPAVVYYARR